LGGQDDTAIACLARASRLDPSSATAFAELGKALSWRGLSAAAAAASLHALTLAPGDPSAHLGLGLALRGEQKFAAASAVYREALKLYPHNACVHGQLGEVFHEQGRSDEALYHCERAMKLMPSCMHGSVRLGQIRLSRCEWRLAAIAFQQGLDTSSDCHELHIGLGDALLHLGQTSDAINEFWSALMLDPGNVSALSHLASALDLSGSYVDAAGAWSALGAALAAERRFHEATVAFREALEREAGSLRSRLGLGRVLMEVGQPAEAKQLFEAVIALDPGQVAAHRHVSDAYQMTGDLVRGWEEAEWHRPPSLSEWRAFEQPTWDGSALDGRTILVWAGGALGDTIQFLRYVPLIKAHGGRLILECPRLLLPLIERFPTADNVLVIGTPLPQFDVHERVTRLPLLFRTQASDVPDHVPYVFANDDLVEQWRKRLAPNENIVVGLSWGGNAASDTAAIRFAPLRAAASLARLRGVRFVSLQLGRQSAELLAPPLGLNVESLLDDSCSLADTAALIASLDVIVTVDTMIAHLAGALARPVWTVLPHVAGWRWLMNTDVSAWYPTMRLFRQENYGEWDEIFVRIGGAIEALAEERAHLQRSDTEHHSAGAGHGPLLSHHSVVRSS
jgi:tetratricopeptide (TPR) repeat protein